MKLFIATFLVQTLALIKLGSAQDHASANLRSMVAANTKSAVDPELERELTYDYQQKCSVSYKLYDSKADKFVADLPDGGTIVNPTPYGRTNIEAVLSCSGGIYDDDVNDDDDYDDDNYVGTVTLELYKGSLIQSRTEKDYPYFLYGNNDENIFDGTIKDGVYRIRVRVNGKWSPFTKFTLVAPALPTHKPTPAPTRKPTPAPTRDCTISWKLFNSKTDKFVADLTNGGKIVDSTPEGRANIEAIVPCADSDDKVTIQLFQGSKLFKSKTEVQSPFFLFGNDGANAFDGKIPAGRYKIRAQVNGKWSPFTKFTLVAPAPPTHKPTPAPTRKPTPAPTRDCTLSWKLFDSKTDKFVADITNGGKIFDSTPEGRTNIEAIVPCADSDDKVTIQLFQGSKLFKSKTEVQSPFFLFGNDGANAFDGKIPAGRYKIRAQVNGKWSPFTKFTLVAPVPPTRAPTHAPTRKPTPAPTRDCAISWKLFNSKTDKFVADLTKGATIAHPPPCGRANIEAIIPCADEYHDDADVTLELFQGSHLVERNTEFTFRYFLFGNRGASISDGNIPAGRYGIRALVDGEWSPFTNFTLKGRCRPDHKH